MAGNFCLDLAQTELRWLHGDPTIAKAVMDRFIRRENVRHYRELLKTVKDEAERQRILKLLAEEQQKQRDAGDQMDENDK